MNWLWLGMCLFWVLPVGMLILLVGVYFYARWKFLDILVRIFEERPLFVVPRGEKTADAQDVRFTTPDGLTLRGCYLFARGPRKGVILFGLEFGSNRWSCITYCEALQRAGYDIFAYEPRNQGESDSDPKYAVSQWVTDRDLTDARAALAYLKSRPDADPRGIGLFGISKGASVGLLAAATDPWVRCAVTDGAFATVTTMIPFIRKWIAIYDTNRFIQAVLPIWFYRQVALAGVRKVSRKRQVRFCRVESAFEEFRRPLLMIHGGGDTYIKPIMAQALFDLARPPKELWMIPGAKHNQSLHATPQEYTRRVIDFFDLHLAQLSRVSQLSANTVDEPLSHSTGSVGAEADLPMECEK